MNLIIPLAGRDPRFTTFKPFIPFHGKPLIYHVVAQHQLQHGDKLIFILLQEHETQYNASKKLIELFGKEIIIRILENETQGAPSSILLGARDLIDNDEPILIELADVLRDLQPFYEDIKNVSNSIAGIIPVQENMNIVDRPWGYVYIDKQGNVAELKEKQFITKPERATMGLYYFSKGHDFVKAAKLMIEKNSFIYKNNYFVGPVYNELISEGKNVMTYHVKIHQILDPTNLI
ncbi:glycosyltransferase family 2 protein [soil metagenome]